MCCCRRLQCYWKEPASGKGEPARDRSNLSGKLIENDLPIFLVRYYNSIEKNLPEVKGNLPIEKSLPICIVLDYNSIEKNLSEVKGNLPSEKNLPILIVRDHNTNKKNLQEVGGTC